MHRRGKRSVVGRAAAAGVIAAGLVVEAALGTVGASGPAGASTPRTATPIQHLVVIVDENVSFDHYFGTYPFAFNPWGEPAFHAAPGTPAVDGLTPALLANNPNSANPFRLDRAQAITCDNSHAYTDEQAAYHGGRMDRFVESVGPHWDNCPAAGVMGYYDGNTVTALWNYAQRFAMSDRSFDATFGPTLLGHLNLVAGQTRGVAALPGSSVFRPTTLTSNYVARWDDCGLSRGYHAAVGGRNIGDLLSGAGVTWGYFSEGFRPTSHGRDGRAVCHQAHRNHDGVPVYDYYPGGIAEPFQFWRSTANPHHVPPRSLAEIGHDGRARHQYDLRDFWAAAGAGRLPAVSFLKPGAYANGHAGSSDPLFEQRFLVDTINRIQRLPDWRSTAIVIVYDDSDGWYDHVAAPITNPSFSGEDVLDGPGRCGSGVPLAHYSGRCGPGPRQPLLVISPWARSNYVDHTVTTQVSVLRFIEDNWLRGRRLGTGSFDQTANSIVGMFRFDRPDPRPLILDPATGEVRP